MNKARILIVEDEAIVAFDLTSQLTGLGYEPVAQTATGEQAIALAEELRPDLVLMDIHLAGALDGVAAAQVIHERFAIPAVFVTAYLEESILDRIKAARPFGYINKPFQSNELRLVIDLALTKHRAEIQLRQSYEEQTAILRTAMDGFWIVNLEGRFLEVNDACCQMSGYSRDELLRMSIAELEADESPDEIAAGIERIKQSGSARFERRHRCKNGRIFNVEISVIFMSASGGRFFCFLRDITERKRMEEILTFLAQTSSKTAIEPFFNALARQLAKSLEMDFICIDRLLGDGLTAQTLAVWCDGKFEDNVAYALKDTPCGEVVGKTVCCFPASVCQFFPRDQVLQDLRAESYVGVTLWSHAGHPIGLIAVIGRRPLANRSLAETTLKLVAARAAGELERLDAEEALRESEHRFDQLAEQSRTFVWEVNDRGLYTYISHVARLVLGYQPEEIVNRLHFYDLHPLDGREEFKAAAFAVFDRKERFVNLENPALTKDGQVVWLLTNGIPIQGNDGELLGYRGSDTDITERKRAEKELRQSRQRLALHVQQAPLAVIEFDLDGRVREWNPAAEAIFRFPREEALGKHWTFMVPESIWGSLDGVWEALVKRRGGSRSTNQNRTKDGQLIDCEWFSTPLIDPQGKVIAVASLVMDVTERKRAEEELTRAKHDLERFFNLVPDLVAMASLDGYFKRLNPEWEKTLGYSVQELLSKPYESFVHPEDLIPTRIEVNRQLHDNKTIRFENRYRHKDGSYRWFEWNATPAVGDLLFAAARDITDRKRLEEKLREAQKMEAIGQLAGGVAHDFNNIMAASMMHLGLLQDNPNLDAETQASLKELMTDAKRASSLTRQLLMFSRRSVLQVKVLDLNELVANLLKMLGRLIGEHISLQFELHDDLPPVEADPGMIEQVLMNLALNARDAMPKGGKLTISIESIRIDTEQMSRNIEVQPGLYVCLSVTDTGCGMDEATLQHIFEPFFTTKEVGKGTGLGLATVYGIVAQHKGWVEVASKLGKGSTFKVFLPAATKGTDELAQTENMAVIHGNETILLVEDAGSLRRLVAQGLRRLGYTVFEAENGQAAIKLWHEHAGQIDLLFSDMVMPEGMTGLDLAEKLREDKPKLKVIITSGYNTEMAGQATPTSGGIEYLQKPYEIHLLSETVRDCLDSKGSI